ATPSLSTVVKDGAATPNTVDDGLNKAALGTSVHDTASLTGQTGYSVDSGATVSYAFFSNLTCASTPVSSEDKTVTAGELVPNSSASGALAAGDYSYQATYNGNANYTTKLGACEPFKVAKAT